jgi:hypothetical protein
MNNLNFNFEDHINCIYASKQAYYNKLSEDHNQIFISIINELDEQQRRTTRECVSAWLQVLPIVKENFDLSAREFRDGLAIRYGKPLLQLPPSCDGCGSDFSITHALDCRRGG